MLEGRSDRRGNWVEKEREKELERRKKLCSQLCGVALYIPALSDRVVSVGVNMMSQVPFTASEPVKIQGSSPKLHTCHM